MLKPCPNCFVLITECEKSKEFFFWLSYGLWQGKFFHEYLIGSVIPFIRIHDAKNLIETSAQKATNNNGQYEKSINHLKSLNHQEQTLKKQLKLMDQLKRVLVLEILKE